MDAPAAVELEFWQATGHPLVIQYVPAVLSAIRTEAIEGLNRLSRGGLEVGGILFGRKDGDRITILAERPIPCEYALGPSFTLSANDERALESLLASPATDSQLTGLEAIGWYHSHTRNDILLSEKDVQLFDRYFPEPWQIALVVCPHRFDPTRAGFFFREPDGSIHAGSTYREFLLKPGECAKASEPRPEPAQRASGPVAMPASGEPNLQQLTQAFVRSAMPLPSSRGSGTPILSHDREAVVEPARRRWTFVAALAVAAALMAGLSIFYSLHKSPAVLALRVFDIGGQLRIDWDRNAAALRRAESAILEISDGGKKRSETLDIAHLRAGSVTYERSSGDVVVRLRLISTDARVVDGSVRFTGPPVQMADAARSGGADRVAAEGPPAARLERPASKRIAKPSSSPSEPILQAPVLQAPGASPLAPAPQPLDSPSAGEIVWTGNIAAPTTLEIRNGHATRGDVIGRLPGRPVKVIVASKQGAQIQIAKAPGPQNAWDRVVLRVKSGEPKTIVLHWVLTTTRRSTLSSKNGAGHRP